ncbi:MAG: hypothetical protein C0404_09000 [Verrucomicrobia bacterium]|nr:hypothetical protein [Verrucomicrobiota bacterium]
MRLYFVRHAETLGNVGGEYDQSSSGTLTPRGQKQARDLVKRLEKFEFSDIIVSPLERVVLTIMPFLKNKGRKAEAWPELAEMRGKRVQPDELPSEIRNGPAMELPKAAANFVQRRPDLDALLLPPPEESYSEGQRRVKLACDLIRNRYAGENVSILVVGHACNGARVIECLMGLDLDGRFQHDNAGITCIEQKLTGDFIMRFQNLAPRS